MDGVLVEISPLPLGHILFLPITFLRFHYLCGCAQTQGCTFLCWCWSWTTVPSKSGADNLVLQFSLLPHLQCCICWEDMDKLFWTCGFSCAWTPLPVLCWLVIVFSKCVIWLVLITYRTPSFWLCCTWISGWSWISLRRQRIGIAFGFTSFSWRRLFPQHVGLVVLVEVQ